MGRNRLGHSPELFWKTLENKDQSGLTGNRTWVLPYLLRQCALGHDCSCDRSGVVCRPQLDLVKQTEEGDISNYQANGEFDLVSFDAVKHIEFYSCCPEPYPDITYVIRIRRRPMFYVFNLILPCILINGIALLVFYVPSESGEKVTLGISALLSMTVFLMTIRESLPPTEKTPLISMYYGVSICLVSFASGLSVVTLNVYHRGVRGTGVPQVVKNLILGKLARLVFLQFEPRDKYSAASLHHVSTPCLPHQQSHHHAFKAVHDKGGGKGRSPRKSADHRHHPDEPHCVNSVVTTPGIEPVSPRWENGLATTTPWLPVDLGVDMLARGVQQDINPRTGTRLDCQRPPPDKWSTEDTEHLDPQQMSPRFLPRRSHPETNPAPAQDSFEAQFLRVLNKVSHTIERNELRLAARERRDTAEIEWKQVALVCDRFLLWVFLLTTAITTTVILCGSPHGP
ncbi:hypothetical protein PR048_024793 [Dryococelus australis]|uniref:Neurotransmitter-gated ion-channel transmembrane domain-containing protein n=1 Tax=Dryococelus australis TaxID=614101 RepID=A0ABQ9GPN2_9NEOP|nr:hypothetical protein PR048_024793 [Dryococelus australis]